MIDDRTEFEPARWSWSTAVALIAAVWLFFLLFVRAALPELARALAASEEWRLRLVIAVVGAGGVVGSLLGAWTFRLVRFQPALGTACRACGAAAALSLVGLSWSVTLLAAMMAGLALGWVAVTLAAGLRGTVGTSGLGRAIGAGTGLGFAFANLPLLLEAAARTQAIVAAIVILTVSVLTPFLTPQEPSLSPRPQYSRQGLIRWTIIAFGLTLLGAAFPIAAHGADSARSGSWPGVFVPGAIAWLAGWWLDKDRRSALVAVSGVALLLLLGAWFTPTGSFIGLVLCAAGAGAAVVAVIYYPARSARAMQGGILFAVGGWVALGAGALLTFSAARLPTIALVMIGVVLLSGLIRQWLEDGVT
jgi:hypothetical protein